VVFATSLPQRTGDMQTEIAKLVYMRKLQWGLGLEACRRVQS